MNEYVKEIRKDPKEVASVIVSLTLDNRVIDRYGVHDLGEEAVKCLIDRTHRTQQQYVARFMVKLIKGWAESYDANMYDLRNEATCKLCSKIVKAIPEEDFYLPFV